MQNRETPTQDSPSLQLPKGGGAIRGIGEKFSVGAVTGTGAMTVPVFTSPGRSGLSPDFSLVYDSGLGNGPFGLGWHLSLPSITRKTEKGMPRYDDGGESDVFLLSEAEDLMPQLVHRNGQWLPVVREETAVDGESYSIKRYRPRTEGMFARIERWQRLSDGDIHWRTRSAGNVANIYGQHSSSRIADPTDPTRVFRWMLESSFDDKGNVMSFVYKPEDSVGIDITEANERNRLNGNAPWVNTYLKRVLYGNLSPYVPGEDLTARKDWLFETVLDYGEHNQTTPTPTPDPALQWVTRADPFSTFRSSFEVRTYRLCQRFLMFHHFPDVGEDRAGYDALVRSTDLAYDQEDPMSARMGNRVATQLLAVTQSGYAWDSAQQAYVRDAFPPVQFAYSQAVIDPTIHRVDPTSLENLPTGLSGTGYQWIDLDGEGSAGMLFEDDGGLYFKRNSSPANTTIDEGVERAAPSFRAQERLPLQPGMLPAPRESSRRFMDLAGDGRQDLVALQGDLRGFYRRGTQEGWEGFRAFDHFPTLNTEDPNVKFIDIDGDGLIDLLVSEDDVLSWHRSLGKYGFGEREYARKPFDEEKGPALIFADPTQCMFLADMTGDGLTDVVRIRSGEVCYWPNRGYGRFGAKVSMDNAPCFEAFETFDQRRIRLADIDGSGTTDVLYLRSDGVTIYFNQSGNRLADERLLPDIPAIHNLALVNVMDLLGNGLSCLVWSSPLPSDQGFPMYYIDLMGGQKPHLLVSTKNNLGLETRIRYASSTKFYVQDRDAGTPWMTRLAFPVYVVERLEVFDYVGRTRLVTTYRYRHGYFDGTEREFRGFGYIEQRDASSFGDSASLFTGDTDTEADALHAPPVVTKTWFHTGAWPDASRILLHMAHEYFSFPASSGPSLLPDAALPGDVFLDDSSRLPFVFSGIETREAVRALKGSVLRQEVYADDGSVKAALPYSVSEKSYTVECFQPQAGNRYAVFYTHAREDIEYHIERNPNDPRITHSLLLDIDLFGNPIRRVHAAYGRNLVQAGLGPAPAPASGTAPDLAVDPSLFGQPEQVKPLFTIDEYGVTGAIDTPAAYRGPMQSATSRYELTLPARPDESVPYSFADIEALSAAAAAIPFEAMPDPSVAQKRLFDDSRVLYMADDLTPVPLGQNGSLGLVYEAYRLAFTPALAEQLLITGNANPQKPADAVALGLLLSGDGGYVNGPADANWWIPSGRPLYSPVPPVPPNPFVQDAGYAAQHFYLPVGHRDPMGQYARTTFDAFDLLLERSEDALGNISGALNDYRVLQPSTITDPNGNQTLAVFDALGMLCGTVVGGKIDGAGHSESGDSFTGFAVNLSKADTDSFFDAPNPLPSAALLLGNATSRIVYNLQRFSDSASANPMDPTQWEPVYAATIVRETHVVDLPEGGQSKAQVSFSYSDGLQREIQKKVQAEPGPLDLSDPGSPRADLRWVGSGWVISDNKGSAIRQYEPFFSATHHFEFAVKAGVTSTVFYDPLQRPIAITHPDHSWEKVVFDPWTQWTWDGNDTATLDPQTDPDTGTLFGRLQDAGYLPTWYGLRTDPIAAAAQWTDPDMLKAQQEAATKVSAHGGTPNIVVSDVLGRPFLTVGHNRSFPANADQFYSTRKQLDITGDVTSLWDALGRLVSRFRYNVAKNSVYQAGMETGERWTLEDVLGQTIYSWDSRGFMRTLRYDELRRPTSVTVNGNGLNNALVGKRVYGDSKQGAPLTPTQTNHLTRLYQSYDAAGVVTHQHYDFKGNVVRSTRRLLQGAAYRTTPDWNQPPLSGETFTSAGRYDALNRALQQVTPYSDQPGAKVNVLQPAYNEANLLEKVDAWLQLGAEPPALLDTSTASLHAVTNIDYDAKGQRVLIEYGVGPAGQGSQVNTAYRYDRNTYLLNRLTTTRKADGVLLQDLQYVYDPVGNVTHIQDDADIQNVVFFKNKRVEPSADYVYDALYRLIKASGREHLGQSGPPVPSYNDWLTSNLPHPNDGNAMGTYIENFSYDPAGSLQQLRHTGSDPANPGWTRTYAYQEGSVLEPLRQSNRLTATTIGGTTETYSTGGLGYDMHGNMLEMPQLQMLHWDFKDQLQMTQRQRVDPDDTDGAQHQGERTYCVYDASGQRVCKVTESAAGSLLKQRMYLGALEVYREYDNAGAVALERESLHVTDSHHRVALVETRTKGDDGTPAELVRFQFSNHLGSASLELDGAGKVISYEEYYSYGGTSYEAVDQSVKIAAKRYRYAGKERDEETGLYYHGARYYAPWLGRWTSADSILRPDFSNAYEYVRSNPVVYADPTGQDWTRFWGGARAVGGAAQAIGGVAFAVGTAETGLGIAAGLAVAAHGVSDYEAGVRQMRTGKDEKSITQMAISAGLQKAHVEKNDAEKVATAADITLGFVNPSGPVSGAPRMAFALANGGQKMAAVTNGFRMVPAISAVGHGVYAMGTLSGDNNDPGSSGGETPRASEKPTETPSEPAPSKPPPEAPPKPPPVVHHGFIKPSAGVAKNIATEGGLTEMANKLKSLGQGKGATVEIVLATTKDGKQILVGGINSGSKGLNAAQFKQLEEWGVNLAPEVAKGMKQGPHAEENIAAYLYKTGSQAVRWSKAVVGELKPGGSSYVCEPCRAMIKRVGGRIEGE